MTLKNLAYATFVSAAAVAFVIGSAAPSEAAKKKAAAAPQPQPVTCFISPQTPVCATKGGQKFTYANTCYASKDGATAAKAGACANAKTSMKKSSKKKKA